ncbi:MAG: zinc ribbon domain-containing protein [Victivallales bacterium]
MKNNFIILLIAYICFSLPYKLLAIPDPVKMGRDMGYSGFGLFIFCVIFFIIVAVAMYRKPAPVSSEEQPVSLETKVTVQEKCTKCNSYFNGNENFCRECGAPRSQTPSVCSQCGMEIEKDCIFCGNCGAPPVTSRETEADLVCKKCNSPLETSMLFCGNCGAKAKNKQRNKEI